MSIALVEGFDRAFDITFEKGDIKQEKGLRTAVLISLFTDARAEDDDVLPNNDNDRRGHWADIFREQSLGSRLWLLSREKTTNDVLLRAKQYTEQALQWMIDDRIADQIIVTTSYLPGGDGLLAISITITRGASELFTETFDYELRGAANEL